MGDAYSSPVIWHSEQTTSTTTNNFYYLHRDYLGSILGITDKEGVFKEKRHFDAWGNIVKLTDGNNVALTKFAILDRGYTGHEHLLGVGIIHMNGRLYDPVLHRFFSPDNFIQEPFNTQNFNRYAYVLNNPLKYADYNGEFFVTAIIGAAIGVITNGISNLINQQPFFRGAGKAAVFGALGGAAAFGIGQVAGSIATSMAASGASTLGTSLTVGAFQAGAHAALGGTLSVAQGGKFGSGALSGALSSAIGSGINGIKINSKLWNAVAKVGASGVAGGIGSKIAGGNFIDGVRQGLISGGLNHGVHSGWFGENIAAAAITQRVRHLFGPDAIALSVNGTAAPGVGIKLEKGGIFLLRGSMAIDDFSGIAAVAGLPTGSIEVSQTNLYFSGSVNRMSVGTFTGTYYELNLGVDAGLSLGVHASYSNVGNHYVLGFGANLGMGVSPVFGMDANLQVGRISTKSNPFR